MIGTDVEGERFYTIPEVARILRVSDQSVRRWIKAGELHATKPGKEYRIGHSNLEEFLRAREPRPKAGGRSSLLVEPTFNDLLAEERPPSILAQAIVTAAERWAKITSEASANPEKAPGIAEAAEDLEELLSVVLGDEELWQSLPTNERDEIAAAASRLSAVSEPYHTERAKEERAELRRQWMRQINLRKESA